MIEQSGHRPIIAIYGGSFDPIHNAHIATIQVVSKAFEPSEFRVVPCHIPPHKRPLQAFTKQRVDMLRFALEGLNSVILDLRELEKAQISYTYDTVSEIRAEKGSSACLCFVIGWDSWVQFSSWFRWRDILDFVNLIVLRRPQTGKTQDQCEQEESLQSLVVPYSKISEYAYGRVAILDNPELDIASSDIREKIASKKNVRDMLPDSVATYIENEGLYLLMK